jgi:hypothetical protein
VPLSGTSGTGAPGSVSPEFSTAISGITSTGVTGNLSTDFGIPLLGNVGTASEGTLGSTFTLPLTGTSSTSDAGTVSPSGAPTIAALTGVSATASAGDLSVVVTSPNVIASARISFESKNASESVDYYFSFASLLSPGETIVTARSVSEYYSGPTAEAGPVVNGAAIIQGVSVKQRFSGGVSGTTYIVTCSVLTSLLAVRRLSAYLVIL